MYLEHTYLVFNEIFNGESVVWTIESLIMLWTDLELIFNERTDAFREVYIWISKRLTFSVKCEQLRACFYLSWLMFSQCHSINDILYPSTSPSCLIRNQFGVVKYSHSLQNKGSIDGHMIFNSELLHTVSNWNMSPINPSKQSQSTQDYTPGSPHDGSSSASSNLPTGLSKTTYSKRGKITIVACVPCRKRKTKVSISVKLPSRTNCS